LSLMNLPRYFAVLAPSGGMIATARLLFSLTADPAHFKHVRNARIGESNMDHKAAVAALGALAQETRLALFRQLVVEGSDGLSAGVIAEKMAVPPSSLSFHLSQLAHAGLISQRRVGRQLFYAADLARMNEMMTYLTENGFGGEPVRTAGRRRQR